MFLTICLFDGFRYYSIITQPMDLEQMEEKLDKGEYMSLSAFRKDFQLIINNCRRYNGSDNGNVISFYGLVIIILFFTSTYIIIFLYVYVNISLVLKIRIVNTRIEIF